MSLTPTQRQYFTLRAQGFTVDEVAARMGIGSQTASNLGARGRRVLRVRSDIQAFVVLGWLRPREAG